MKGFVEKVSLKKEHLTLNFSLIFCHEFLKLEPIPCLFETSDDGLCCNFGGSMPQKVLLVDHRCFFIKKKRPTHRRKKQVGRLSVLLPAFSWRFFCEKCFKVKIEDIFFQVFPFKKRITYWIPTKFFRIFVSWMASSSPSMEIVVWTPAAGLRFGVLINKQ